MLLEGSGTQDQLQTAWKNIGDHFAERQNWHKVFVLFEQPHYAIKSDAMHAKCHAITTLAGAVL